MFVSNELLIYKYADKNIGCLTALSLLKFNSQWKMHHCIVLCLVLSSLCSLQAYNYAEHLYNILCAVFAH